MAIQPAPPRRLIGAPGLTARRWDEEHRSATPLELFFDLCFVVAVAQAGTLLVEATVEGHPAHAISGYLFVFFGIWWAWVNFTWAASAAVTIPAALFLFAVWVFHARFTRRGVARQVVLPVTALLVLASTFAGHWAVPLAGLIAAGAVAVGTRLARAAERAGEPGDDGGADNDGGLESAGGEVSGD
jgi:hypothetical protein